MPAYRFFLDTYFAQGAEHELPPAEYAHVRVMRLHEREELELVNGRGQLATATLGKKGRVTIGAVHEEKLKREIILCQAIPRTNRLDGIVEKGTELSMTHLWLFPGERSEKKSVGKERLSRLHAITVAALKQSGRLHLPILEEKPPLEKWTSLPHPGFFGSLDQNAHPFSPDNQSICFFIGPEAGLSPFEEKKILELGAKGVSLGPNILRTDTAALVALSLIQLKGK